MLKKILFILLLMGQTLLALADVTLPSIFSDHMVLQRNQANPIWGTALQGEKVVVSFAGQTHKTVADNEGNWRIILDPLEAGGPFELVVKGNNKWVIEDVLIGEVGMCSGQSNMAWFVKNSNHADVELATANYPQIRLMRIPKIGSPEAQTDMEVDWKACTPEHVGQFSAVGYFFGRRLHHALGVPIGLIDNSWGGSAIEAWIPRPVMEENGAYKALLKSWDKRVSNYSDEVLAKELADFEAWIADGKPGKKRFRPNDIRTGRHRPGNIYNAMVRPAQGYGIKGIIWCQGETNANRAYQYRSLFPLLINSYRERWDQGSFPFYWVQMADFGQEVNKPKGSPWAELREAQTMTLSLPHTGEAIVIDIGEARDIHPRNKQTAADRLVRHALAKDYGFDMASESPRYDYMEIQGNKAIITFEHVQAGLYSFDIDQPLGFAIAGKDKKFVWAEAKIIGRNQVEVFAKSVKQPIAVRYGWEQNPVVNLYDRNGLPVTPFRTDNWPEITRKRKK